MSGAIDRVLGFFARASSRIAEWHRWPFPLSVAIVIGLRANMRKHNLSDTEVAPSAPQPPGNLDIQSARTVDGTHNDLAKPAPDLAAMSQLAESYGEKAPTLYEPNPRLVSTALLARRKFVPVRHLNLLVAA